MLATGGLITPASTLPAVIIVVVRRRGVSTADIVLSGVIQLALLVTGAIGASSHIEITSIQVVEGGAILGLGAALEALVIEEDVSVVAGGTNLRLILVQSFAACTVG